MKKKPFKIKIATYFIIFSKKTIGGYYYVIKDFIMDKHLTFYTSRNGCREGTRMENDDIHEQAQ